MPSIHLLPVGDVASALAADLAAALEDRFASATVVEQGIAPRAEWLERGGKQYRAGAILDHLVANPPADGGWRVALLQGDLSAPGLAFAFGLSTLGGCCAVVALERLDPARHGQPPDPDRLFRRALTELVHELGHIAGVQHCPDPACAMYFSLSVEDTDRKGVDFCARCREGLEAGG